MLLAAVACPALVWTNSVFGQARKLPVLIGWLNFSSHAVNGRNLTAFKEGMTALGWREGSEYVLDERWAAGRMDRLRTLAGELATKAPVVIVAAPLTATNAAARASPGIPVVQANGGSPVTAGLAKSLARPGGMVTGVTNVTAEISEKFPELLLAAAPTLKRVGFLVDTNDANRAAHLQTVGRSATRIAEVGRAEEIEPAMARLAKGGVQGLVLIPSPGLFQVERRRVMKLALSQRWPVIAGDGETAEEGALLSYGTARLALFRRAAYYVDRILKGGKPGDLPIEQPTTFELVINLKTARALGITIPEKLLLRADRVIE